MAEPSKAQVATQADVLNAQNVRRRSSIGAVEIQDQSGRRHTVQLDELSDADRELAAKFGYKPVFKREFGWLSAFSFAVSISGVFSTVTTTFIYPLEAGGSASAVWCWLIAGVGCMCIACSVAELVSAFPTSGGLYYTVSYLAPPAWVPSVSWVTGWLNLLGQVAGVASSEYGGAQILLAAVSMGSGYNDDLQTFNYTPTVNQTVGVMAASTILSGLVNSLSTKALEKMTKGYVIFHVAVLISCCIALLVKTDGKNSSEYVWTNVEGAAGWEPWGFSFLFGFLSVQWTMTDYDATAHIAEEMDEPEVKAPWAITLAMTFTYIAGWLFTIVLCYCMGNPTADDGILSSPMQQPVVQIFYNSLGPAGGITFAVCAFVIIKFLCFAALQALARTVFAFSRDKLLPLSRVWLKVNKWSGTPLYAVWVSTVCCVLINLIGLGSYAAISGVFNVTAIALDWSYCIPIFCKLVYGRFDKPGPFYMGKIGYFVNAWACIWTFWATIIFILPTIMPVTPDNMNYAIVFLAFILLMAAIFWYIPGGGKQYYTGPLNETDVIDGGSTSGSDVDSHGKSADKAELTAK